MQLENYVNIPGKNIAMEIIMNNNNQPILIQFLIFSVYQFLIPISVSYFTDTPFFSNDYHYYVFWLQFPTQLYYQCLGLFLFYSMNILMFRKKCYSQTLLTMLKNEMRSYYNVNHEMPQINIHSPSNLNQILSL